MRARLAAAIAAAAAALALPTAPAQAADYGGQNIIIATISAGSAWGGTPDPRPTGIRATVINQATGTAYPLDADNYSNYFSLSLPDGDYKLRVEKTGYATVWWPGAWSQAAAGTFKLDSRRGPDAAGNWTCNIYGDPQGCGALLWGGQVEEPRAVSGAVRKRGGQGVAVPVTARLLGESQTQTTVTSSAAGAFALSLPPGTWQLSAPNGNRTATTTVDLTGDNRPSVSAEVTLLDTPGAPRTVEAAAGSKTATVRWMPPADDGGAPITSYTVTASPGGRTCTTDRLGCEITGLLNNTAYTFRVTAENAVGSGAASTPTAPVTPLDPAPTAPRGVSATAGSRSATVSWLPPSTGADTVTGYNVTSTPGGRSCTTRDLTCTVEGLANGTAYVFTVTAVSTGGTSPESLASNPVTPAAAPSAPRNVQANAGDKQLAITWNAPADDGGLPIAEYVATAYPGGRTCHTTDGQRACTISGLTNGTAYSVVVTAQNGAGISERSPGSAQTTPKAASSAVKRAAAKRAAVTLTGKARKGKVRARWTAARAHSVIVSWTTAGRTHHKTAGPRGTLVVKAAAGQRVRIVVTAHGRDGRAVARARAWTTR